MLADEPPKATINCSVIQPLDSPGLWYVHINTQGFDGKKVARAEDRPFKKRSQALKECDRVVGQWENLYNQKPKKSK